MNSTCPRGNGSAAEAVATTTAWCGLIGCWCPGGVHQAQMDGDGWADGLWPKSQTVLWVNKYERLAENHSFGGILFYTLWKFLEVFGGRSFRSCQRKGCLWEVHTLFLSPMTMSCASLLQVTRWFAFLLVHIHWPMWRTLESGRDHLGFERDWATSAPQLSIAFENLFALKSVETTGSCGCW